MFILFMFVFFIFCFKPKTAYEWRISDWSSDVCSSDLVRCVIGGLEAVRQCQAGTGFLDFRRIAKTVQDDVRALRGQRGGDTQADTAGELGRVSCRERVCQYV